MAELNRTSRKVSWMRRTSRRILGFPLTGKIIGANVVIVIASLLVHWLTARQMGGAEMVIILGSLAAASIVSLILVRFALDPVRQLTALAERVSRGDFNARAIQSPLADNELTRLGATINAVLDALAAERKRIQDLGAEVVFAQDAERARVSRELHDSIAQTLAAARFQIAAAVTQADGDLRNRLIAIGALILSVMEEVKKVSYSLHPRVAEDLGLEAALNTLAKQVHARSGVEVEVSVSLADQPVAANISATLFRVAEEALRNIEMHASAKTAKVYVDGQQGSVRLEVVDDGCGFDQARDRIPAGGSGLARVRDRVTLAGGCLNVESTPNGGTRVIAELKTLKAAS